MGLNKIANPPKKSNQEDNPSLYSFEIITTEAKVTPILKKV